MRTYTTLDLGTQRPTSRWRLAGLFGLFGAAAGALSSCVNDPDCGVCDPDNLILQSIAGVNYAGKIVKLLGPECEGESCPGPITEGEYFVEKVIPCIETDEAINAPRGVDEWCRVSPLIVDSGIQFIFNNLLDPLSVELVRKQPVNPQLIEVFDWKTQIVRLEGPITRFNGDYRPGATQTKPDTITRSTNLACIENLAKAGIPYDHTVEATRPSVMAPTRPRTASSGRSRPSSSARTATASSSPPGSRPTAARPTPAARPTRAPRRRAAPTPAATLATTRSRSTWPSTA
jgi:hypothetical protein